MTNIAVRVAAGGVTAAAVVGVAALYLSRPIPVSTPPPPDDTWVERYPDSSTVREVAHEPPPPTRHGSDINAADLVGVYRARKCTLTLDASGTYTNTCWGAARHRYTIEHDEVVLDHDVRLTVVGRLLVGNPLADHETYSITGGVK
jgi:hypothetical protein